MKNDPYAKGLRLRVFDIETNGLYAKAGQIISASFVDADGGGLSQYFAQNSADEERLLREMFGEIENCDGLITYNGNRFDLPFMAVRLKHFGIADSLPLLWSIDLYRWLKHYWPLAKTLEHLRQKDVEEALGLSKHRTDEIDGDECIQLYTQWLRCADYEARRKILLHNGDDVRQLAAISQNLSFMPWHIIAYEEGFFIRKNGSPCRLYGNRWERGVFKLKAKTRPWNIPASFFEDQYRLEYDSPTGNISLTLMPDLKEGRTFIDLRDLPVAEKDFEPLAGYHNGYLVLKDEEKLYYQEINRLCAALTETVL